MNNINDLLIEKNKIEAKLYEINNKIYHICSHRWITDYVNNEYTKEDTKIVFCCFCELNKRK